MINLSLAVNPKPFSFAVKDINLSLAEKDINLSLAVKGGYPSLAVKGGYPSLAVKVKKERDLCAQCLSLPYYIGVYPCAIQSFILSPP